ncbi:MAG: CHASE2 domain-containing protein, partial [Candidatus Omnitrophica bacterium]|nr:CHASE2 domain-containing protein [Candidatus Omnitrophota bacterium]
YPRSFFAKVIENLKQAGARVIAFDFVFLGKSTPEDDTLLKRAFESEGKSVLAATINEEGSIEFSTNTGLSNGAPSGIITKFQDPDGVTRKNLTYLVSDKEATRGFFSWEMRILKEVKEIDLSSFETKNSTISFKAKDGEKWIVPVSKNTKSFLIHFRAHTLDFRRLSFSKALDGDFDPAIVKDKIVLVGFSSSVFGDLHNTPIGWLPGLTLNANAFLTLYAHDFLRNSPKYLCRIALVLGIILSSVIVTIMRPKIAILLIVAEVAAFFAASYIFFAMGYVYNYSIFPIAVFLCPLISKKIYLLFLDKETIYY